MLVQTTPTAPLTKIQSTLNRIGWDIHYIDIDLTGQHPKCEIVVSREDGRWLFLRGDALGRFSMETWQRTIRLGMPSNRKRGACLPLSPHVEDQFFGRRTFSGARVMIRFLCDYLTDNATGQACLNEVRDAFRLAINAPLKHDEDEAKE